MPLLPHPRLMLSCLPETRSEEGWQTVVRRQHRSSQPASDSSSRGRSPPRHPSRPQPSLPPRPQPTPAPSAALHAPLPKVLIPATPGFESTLDLAEALEMQLQTRLSLKFLESGCVLVTPTDRHQHDALLGVKEVSGVPVSLRVAPGANTKGVLLAYPVAMPLKPLLRHPRVLEAERCSTRDGPTRQVFVTVAGPLPGTLDLGSWGVFYTRPYNREPLRCYNCQQFGHHRARCTRPPVCGICSAGHDTERCLTKYKAGQDVTSKCPNCHQEHHAWNKTCANRRVLVDQQRAVQQRWVETHRPAPPGTFRWGSQQPPVSAVPPPAQQAPPAPSPPAPYEVSFPALTPHHQPPPLPAQPTPVPAVPPALLLPVLSLPVSHSSSPSPACSGSCCCSSWLPHHHEGGDGGPLRASGESLLRH
ncbi:uncharacterized protein LOC126994355 [Eriocheir sinensis]|uniref:uncharacterized protein LOC126994355 n=1 Tax=Eriocheir sinensis TaxID=95602 RepID=UPI0021C9AF76|nr:uncharacterized protein LOC126994355 [Eriocheir sinensis]